MKSPVLIIVFNRPEFTRRILDVLKIVKPKRLYISADGPREKNVDDLINCSLVKEILSNIEWECQVFKKYSDINLGCKKGVSSAVSWFFENETEGIVLEDDCLPSLDFFSYMDDLLEKYRHESCVGYIGGSNFLDKNYLNLSEKYIFSHLGSIWGWGGWRRSWMNFDLNLDRWGSQDIFKKLFKEFKFITAIYLWGCYLLVKKFKIDTWDYQWMISSIMSNQMAIVPHANLIKNIGILGAHTTSATKYNDLPQIPYYDNAHVEPIQIKRSLAFDSAYQKKIIIRNIHRVIFSILLRKFGIHSAIKKIKNK